jgi:hypothetical protein
MIPADMSVYRFTRSSAVIEEIMQRPFRCKDRDTQAAGEHVKPPDMIPVFMGDEHRPDPAWIKGCPVHSPKGLFRAQPGIDEECTALTFKIYTIAFAPAGKDRAAHCPIIGCSRIRVFNSVRFSMLYGSINCQPVSGMT